MTILFTSLQASYENPAYNVVSRTQDHQDTTFYSETLPLGERSAMSTMIGKTRELGTATLGGLVVGAILSTILGVLNAPFYSAIGSFIGGIVAAYLLRGKIGQATIAGALSGILGTPFLLGFSDILAIFDLIPTPPGPTPTLAELQAAVVIIAGMDLVAGAIGGAIFGAVYHPPGQLPPTPLPQSVTGTGLGQVRYCVQCGAQLPAGALICPHCNARQPQ